MLKNYLLLVIIFFITPISAKASCEDLSILTYKGKKIELCHDKKSDSYLSKNCQNLKECFLPKPVKLIPYKNQSPGFSLCYQIKGEAFFGDIKGVKERIPMCKKGQFFADQESLLLLNR